MPLLLGSYAPDMMSKWFVYGIHVGGWDLKASDPVQFHRGWPGVGFTHSLLYGVVWALIFWRVFGSRTWAISFLIGEWAHVYHHYPYDISWGARTGCMPRTRHR